MQLVALALIVLVATLAAAPAWRLFDVWLETRAWRRLAAAAPADPPKFDTSMVDNLPELVQRYFLFMIAPGARLSTVSEIIMSGELSMGGPENYQPMQARQILAPPHGLLWRVGVGRWPMRITGSDGLCGARSWTRFWLAHALPIVRVGDDADHRRSAFGRLIAEAVFWAPAALLPRYGATWEAVNADVARVTVRFEELSQSVDVAIAADGRPTKVVMQRWSNANSSQTYQLQPFGGHLSDFQEFDGYTLPTRVDGGNFIDTPDYFPFYKARVEGVHMRTR